MGLCADNYYRKSKWYEGHKYIGCGKTDLDSILDLADKITKAKAGSVKMDDNLTVKAWTEKWLEIYVKPRVRAPGTAKKKGTMSPGSYAMYPEKINGYIIPAIGHLKLKDVRDIHLQQILNNEAGKSQSHVSKIKIVIQMMFRQAHISRLINYDPALALILPDVSDNGRRSLTEKELYLLHQAAKIHRCGLWIETMLGTGIRPCEGPPLLVSDFDFDNKLLNIDNSLEKKNVIGPPKSIAGYRKIPIPEDLVDSLKAAFKGKSPDDFAFPQTDGIKMKTQECVSHDWESFRKCMDRLGGAKTIFIRRLGRSHTLIKEIRTIATHSYKQVAIARIMSKEDGDDEDGTVIADDLVLDCLRHSYCTDLKRAEVPVDIAKTLMGHEDIRTTANIYQDSDEKDALLAAPKIDAYRAAIAAAASEKAQQEAEKAAQKIDENSALVK